VTVRRRRLAVVVCALVLLGALAAWQLSRPTPRWPDYDAVVSFDPAREGGHLLPNLDLLVQGERRGHPVRFITNSKGFRSRREFAHQVPRGVERILLLGDSYIDGMRTDQERTLGHVLEQTLRGTAADGADVEVLISGHNNPTNAWYYFQEHGYKYAPRLVILGVTLGNDLTWYSYQASFIPTAGPDGAVDLRPVASPRQVGREQPDLLLPADAYRAPSWLDPWEDREMRLRSVLASRAMIFAGLVPPVVGHPQSRRRHVYAADFFTSLVLFYRPLMPEGAGMFADFEAVLGGLARLVERRGSRLLVVLFPTRFQVSTGDWRLLARAYSLDPARFNLDGPNRRIADHCRKLRLDCLDLLAAFQAAEPVGGLYRPRGDMHLDESGQALAAREIARHLRASTGAGRRD
jgi:hypothetical protein